MNNYWKRTRIISRIDLNNGQLVKGKLLEGLRKLGDPIPYLKSYYFDKLDEMIADKRIDNDSKKYFITNFWMNRNEKIVDRCGLKKESQ